MQSTLFTNPQPIPPPSVPFAPRSATSAAAAEKVAPMAEANRARVMALYRAGLRLTADEVAEALTGDVLVWRPRVTDCRNAGLLIETDEVRPNRRGNRCIVLRLATRDELETALCRHELAAANGDKRAASLAAWVRAELEAAA